MRSNQGSARRAGSYPSYLSYLSYQSYLYTSQPLDPETSLYNYSARLYNPKLAQFTSPDSLITHNSLPTTHNSFTYARQNPLGFQQPLPLETFQPPQIPETPQTAPSTQPSLNPPLRIRDYTEVIRERVEGKYNIRFSAGDSPWTAAEMLHITKILDLVPFHLYGNIPTLESPLEFVHNLAADYPAYSAGKNAVYITFSEKFTGGWTGAWAIIHELGHMNDPGRVKGAQEAAQGWQKFFVAALNAGISWPIIPDFVTSTTTKQAMKQQELNPLGNISWRARINFIEGFAEFFAGYRHVGAKIKELWYPLYDYFRNIYGGVEYD